MSHKIRRVLNIDCHKLIYYSLLYQNLLYCGSIWGTLLQLDKIFFVRYKEAMFVQFLEHIGVHTGELFHNRGLIKLEKKIFHALLLVFFCV